MHVVKAGQSDMAVQYMHVAVGGYMYLSLGFQEMDPRVSATILGLLDRVPGAESLP